MSPAPDRLAQFEAFIRRDPGRRGLLGTEDQFPPLLPGQLGAAAADLLSTGRAVAILTGFFIPGATPPAAETDGPPGALRVAQTLRDLGIDARILTDRPCEPALRALAAAADFPESALEIVPLDASSSDPTAATRDWCRAWWESEFGQKVTHLVAIERVGPSHTPQSLAAQLRPGPAPLERFLERCPPESHDRPHNMRGVDLSAHTAPLHLLFEPPARPGRVVRTIGIGDGGNELGMGQVPWEELVRRLPGDSAGKIPCRIAAHLVILAGVSNWGGYALSAALAMLAGRVDLLAPFTCQREFELLQAMVDHGPAVDGVTRLQQPTVDGLPFLTYIQPWAGIRRLLGLDE